MEWPVIAWLLVVVGLLIAGISSDVIVHPYYRLAVSVLVLALPCLVVLDRDFGWIALIAGIVAYLTYPSLLALTPLVTIWFDHNWLFLIWVLPISLVILKILEFKFVSVMKKRLPQLDESPFSSMEDIIAKAGAEAANPDIPVVGDSDLKR